MSIVEADALCQQARRAYESGSLREAADLIRRSLEADDGAPRSIELYGMILYSQGRYRASVAHLENASLCVPLKLTARICLAHAYGRVGRQQLSCDLLLMIAKEDGVPPHLLLQVAAGLDSINRPDLAVPVCRRVSSMAPHVGQVWYDMGYYVGRAGGDNEQVESLARHAISLDPFNTRFRVGLSGLLCRMERKDEAYPLIADLSKAEIESVHCGCCLGRMAALYETARDYRRVVIVRQKLLLLNDQPHGQSHC